MRSILPAVISLVLPLAAFTAAVPGASPSSAMSTLMSTADGASPKPPKVEGVRRLDVQRLEMPAGMPDTVAITVQIGGKREVLRLTRTSLRSGNAKLLLDKGNGVLEEAPLPPHRTYRGTVESNGALVSASIIDGRLSAMVDMPGDTWFVQPRSDFEPGYTGTEHIVYGRAAVTPFDDFRCGNDEYKLGLPDWMLDLPTDPGEGGQVGSGAELIQNLGVLCGLPVSTW